MNVKTFFTWMCFWSLHFGLFTYGIFKQKNDPEMHVINHLGWSLYLSRAAGLVLALDVSLILLPVCRNFLRIFRSFKWTAWLPFDENIRFHKALGYSILLFTIVHVNGHFTNFFHIASQFPSLGFTETALHFHTWAGVTGHGLLWVMFFMYTSTALLVKKFKFEFFWYSHQLYLLFFVFYCTHAFSCLVNADNTHQCKGYNSSFYAFPGLGLYIFEKIYRELRAQQPTELIAALFHPGQLLELRFKKPSMKYQPGQYLYLNVPEIAMFEWHPFTISSTPEEEFISVHIKVVGDWTRKLNEKLRAIETLKKRQNLKLPCIRIDGPFGAPAQDVDQYEVAVLISAGIGITPSASILKAAWFNYQKTRKFKRMHFIWLCRNKEELGSFQSVLLALEETVPSAFLTITIYLTGALPLNDIYNISINDALQQKDVITNLRSKCHYGRPIWNSVFEDIKKGCVKSNTQKIGIFFCGPKGLGQTLRKTAHAASNSQVQFILHKENF